MRFTKEEIFYIKENAELLSATEIAKNINRSPKTISNKIKKLGLSSNEPGKSKFSRRSRKYECNDDFFSIPSILNSYWAGFISADGSISIRGNNKSLIISLGIKDIIHLEKFKNSIGYTNNIRIFNHKLNGKLLDACSISITSNQIVEDLEKTFSITPRKTFTNNPPKLVNSDMIDSFIIGYIDGDGCISDIKPKKYSFWIHPPRKLCQSTQRN